MAQEVASQFTSTQLDDYGNIILNGYATSGPNTAGTLAWQYQETTTAPVPLPSVTSYRPALKGWTTNYMQYYTQLPPNAYSQVPGNPTMFEYVVHSYTPLQAPIRYLTGYAIPGSGYTPGTYTAVATTTTGSGSGATVDVVVNAAGEVTSITLNAPGTDYSVGDGITPVLPGTGAQAIVGAIDILNISGGGDPQWAQCPRRFFQNQVSSVTPPQYINNPQAIAYSFMYPVADNPVPPPIDTL
jgi:hypothetical protein